jgi:hypothetical protein
MIACHNAYYYNSKETSLAYSDETQHKTQYIFQIVTHVYVPADRGSHSVCQAY